MCLKVNITDAPHCIYSFSDTSDGYGNIHVQDILYIHRKQLKYVIFRLCMYTGEVGIAQ